MSGLVSAMQGSNTTSVAETAPTWQIRPYQRGDEHELVSMFERVFGRSITEAHWRWKLKAHSSPIENVWLSVSDGKPIFQYAGIPVLYQLLEGAREAMVSVDTMTDPAFRRRGLLTEVGRVAYEQWRAAGVPFVIGLPNEKWGSRTTALGWQRLFPLRWFVRPLRPEAMLARRVGLPALASLSAASRVWNSLWNRAPRSAAEIRIRQVECAGPEFDALWQSLAAEAAFSAVRNSSWVNWRFLAAPLYNYRVWLAERDGKPIAYLAGRLDETADRKVAFIADMLVSREDHPAQQALLRHVAWYFYDLGAEMVATLAVPETWLAHILRRTGFLFSWGQFSVELVPLDSTLPLERMRDPQQWRLSGGDFDVI
jgi:hypothetical protein